VKELAAAASVTTGAFYSHFDSKVEAFDAALGRGLDEVIENIPQ
jgi:AcrR family transcriptional regulator